jgi:hypothetical protein
MIRFVPRGSYLICGDKWLLIKLVACLSTFCATVPSQRNRAKGTNAPWLSSIVNLQIWHADARSVFFLTVSVRLSCYLELELQFTLAA